MVADKEIKIQIILTLSKYEATLLRDYTHSHQYRTDISEIEELRANIFTELANALNLPENI